MREGKREEIDCERGRKRGRIKELIRKGGAGEKEQFKRETGKKS